MKTTARFPVLLLSVLILFAAGLTYYNFSQHLPVALWRSALWSADPQSVDQMVFHYSLLPRLSL